MGNSAETGCSHGLVAVVSEPLTFGPVFVGLTLLAVERNPWTAKEKSSGDGFFVCLFLLLGLSSPLNASHVVVGVLRYQKVFPAGFQAFP